MTFNLPAVTMEGLYDGMTRIELAATDRKRDRARAPCPRHGCPV